MGVSKCPIIKKFKPWINKTLSVLITQKNKLFKKWKSSHNEDLLYQYKKLKNNLISTLRNAKKDYFTNRFLSFSHNSTQTWKLINSLLKKKSHTKDSNVFKSILIDDKPISNKKDIANTFCKYYASIPYELRAKFSEKVNSDHLSAPNSSNLSLDPISYLDIERIISSLPNRSSRDSFVFSSSIFKKN